MRLDLRAVILACAVVAGGPAWADDLAGKASPADAETQTISLYMSSKAGLAVLRVGDGVPLPVVFDTGAGANSLDLKVADKLGLPNRGPSRSTDGSGKPVGGHETFIANAKLGAVPIPDGPANASTYAYSAPDEAGAFSLRSFPDRFVVFDGPGARLLIKPRTAANTPEGPPFQFRRYNGPLGSALPAAELDFGGLVVPAMLDSGSTTSIILPMKYKDQLSLQSPPVEVGFAMSAAQKLPIYRARLRGPVSIGPVSIDQPDIYFMETNAPKIGFPILRLLSVLYDASGERDWILASDRPK